jgi:hypothetical protein
MPIDRNRYGSQGRGESRPKLTADMIQGNKTVLTIKDVVEVNGPGGPTWAITFEEFADHTYWTNKTQQDAFLEAVDLALLPDDLKGWVGKRIPIYKKQNVNPETNEKVWKLYAMPADLWQEALAAFDKARTRQPSRR